MKHRIDELKGKLQPGYISAIDVQPLEYQLKMFLDACSADVLVLVDQPGITSEDFRFTTETASLWTQFARYFRGCSVVFPYMQTKLSLDIDKIAQHYIRECQAEIIIPDLTKNNHEKRLFDHYVDIRPRVIMVKFPELPTNIVDRQDVLFENDLLLNDIIKAAPSPLYSIIYTNSLGFNATRSPGLFSEYYIINEVVLANMKKTNRDGWKRHAPPPEGKFLGNLGDVKPPLVQHERRQSAERARRAAIENKQRLAEGHALYAFAAKLNTLLSVQSIVLFLCISIMGWIFLTVIRMFCSVFKPRRQVRKQANINLTPEKDEVDENDESDDENDEAGETEEENSYEVSELSEVSEYSEDGDINPSELIELADEVKKSVDRRIRK